MSEPAAIAVLGWDMPLAGEVQAPIPAAGPSPTRKVHAMSMTHEPDQAVFRSVLPEDVDWEPFAAFPPSARLAVLVGHPSEPGPYVVRVKVPAGVKLMPHVHREDRVYTVISGVFYIGRGDQFDEGKLEAYPSGSVIVLPGGTAHFHWAKSGEYVTQVTATGPITLEYINSQDDPRN
jgi:quercetin dioxygenase-like cupin family protein